MLRVFNTMRRVLLNVLLNSVAKEYHVNHPMYHATQCVAICVV